MRSMDAPDLDHEDTRWRELRARMVEEQIEGHGIRDPRVVETMRWVPRHRFVPPELESDAYADRPLSIGHGQTISQPYIVAAMTAALDVHASHRVLEIGTGCGYQTAVLARLAREVVSIERLPELAERARVVLAALGVANARVVVGDGSLGYTGAEPVEQVFDRIMVTAAAPAVPMTLAAQLAPDGLMVIPVGTRSVQRLLAVRRDPDGGIRTSTLDACVFVPLVGAEAWES